MTDYRYERDAAHAGQLDPNTSALHHYLRQTGGTKIFLSRMSKRDGDRHIRQIKEVSLYWPTPVLGTGCLQVSEEALDDIAERIRNIAVEVQRLIGAIAADHGNTTMDDALVLRAECERFLCSLVDDRTALGFSGQYEPEGANSVATTAGSAATTHDIKVLAHTSLLVATLTALFHARTFARSPAVWRDRDDEFQVGQWPVELGDIKSLIDELIKRIRHFNDKILTTLVGPFESATWHARDLQRLTEFVWLALVEPVTTLLPSWREMLYRLGRESDGFHPVPKREDPRPRILQRKELSKLLGAMFGGKTYSGTSTTHVSVARLLIALAAIASQWPDQKGLVGGKIVHPLIAWPTPVAYSLSFDEELERALANEIEEQHQDLAFSVIHPVVVVYNLNVKIAKPFLADQDGGGEGDEEELPEEESSEWIPELRRVPLWLGRQVRAGSSTVDSQTQESPGASPSEPRESPEWFVVGGSATWTSGSHVDGEPCAGSSSTWKTSPAADKPVVVHLLGAPLEPLPSDSGEQDCWVDFHKDVVATITGKTEENFEIVEVSWHHDILVDEFAVAQRTQFETEARGEFSGARAEKGWLSPALPEDLRSTRCVNKAVRRAWIAEGVSLGDPPVRQRLASLVAGTGVSGQSAFGVVTNPSFGLSEHELFSWNEITPIEAPHSRVADWLDHLAEQFEEMSK